MVHCSHCSQLIQDAAGYCRFCRRGVTPAVACSDKWTQFGNKFHRLSADKQQTAWDQLKLDDRAHVQKVLGIVPPQLPGIREVIADLTESRKSLRSASLLHFFMLLSFCLLIIAGAYFLLPIIEAPISESGDGGDQALSTLERIDQVIDRAYETVALLVADFGGAATDTISSRAGDIASDTQPPAPPNP